MNKAGMTEEQETFERFLPEKDKAFKYCAECGCELGRERQCRNILDHMTIE